ncbi:MAG: prepilin-type N-terminal cleavage/methylation domain-containing protein [Candidatus Babeliales bacterium]
MTTLNSALYTHYKGFLLIELLVALAMISFLSLMIAQYQGTIMGMHGSIQQRVQALHAAASFLEQVIGGKLAIGKKGKKEYRDDEDDQDPSMVLEWVTHAPAPIQGIPIAELYQYITVTISWQDTYYDQKRFLTLKTGLLRG